MNKSCYIDENDLPFTEEELFRAFALTEDEEAAREAVRTLAELLSGGAYEGGWSIADGAFAALALLSEDLRDRVNVYMAARWEGMRWSAARGAMRREGLPPSAEPTAAALQAADDEIARYVDDWRRGYAAFAEWVRRRKAGETVGDEPPQWPGTDENWE